MFLCFSFVWPPIDSWGGEGYRFAFSPTSLTRMSKTHGIQTPDSRGSSPEMETPCIILAETAQKTKPIDHRSFFAGEFHHPRLLRRSYAASWRGCRTERIEPCILSLSFRSRACAAYLRTERTHMLAFGRPALLENRSIRRFLATSWRHTYNWSSSTTPLQSLLSPSPIRYFLAQKTFRPLVIFSKAWVIRLYEKPRRSPRWAR